MNKEFKIFPDIESLNNFAAEKFVEIANEAIELRGKFSVALSGGSTPKSLYRLLASEKFKGKIDWSKVFFFFGDERNVPPDDERSNFRMADENLFQPLGGNASVNERVEPAERNTLLDSRVSALNIFRWRTELGDAAEDYEQRIKDFFGPADNPPTNAGGSDKNFPRFDLILLGMGADGHTASLFPFTDAVVSSSAIAVANFVEKLSETRLTFTFAAINNARNIIFLVNGQEKADALREVLKGEYDPEKFPAQKVKPYDGNLLWLVDAEAARFLN